MRLACLLLLAAGCATEAPIASPPPAPIVAVPRPAALPASVTARLCIHCNGVQPVDPGGRAYANLFLAIDARAELRNVRVTAIEITDANGTIVTRGSIQPFIRVSEPVMRDVGTFDGTVAASTRVALWAGIWLDIQATALSHGVAARYRVHLVSDAGELDVTGEISPMHATG